MPPPPHLPTDADAGADGRRLGGNIMLSAPHVLHDVRPIYTHDLVTGEATVHSRDHVGVAFSAAYQKKVLLPSHTPLMLI